MGKLVFTKQVPLREPCPQGVKSPLRVLGVFVQFEYKETQHKIDETLVWPLYELKSLWDKNPPPFLKG